jgi:hypothetical protein
MNTKRILAGLLVLAALGWLAYAAVWLLGPPLPRRGVLITAPMEATVRFERGAVNVSGGARLFEYQSGWWALALGGPFALVAVFALLGSQRMGRARER